MPAAPRCCATASWRGSTKPSRVRGGEVADMLMTVVQGAATQGDRDFVAGRLRLALRLIYAGRPLEEFA